MRFSVRHELDSIRRLLRAGKRQVSQEQLQRYAVDGTLPEDPLTAAYLKLTEAAQRCMVTCIGGAEADHEQAVEAYQVALSDWQRACRGT